MQETAGGVVGEVAEAESDASQVLQASVDGLGGAVRCVGVVG